MIKYLTKPDVRGIHNDLMKRLGQPPQPFVKEDDLESALARPQNTAHYEGADFIAQAAILTLGIAKSHGFMDGNKRTAYASLIVFLRQNRYDFVGDRAKVGPLIEHLTELPLSRQTEQILEHFLRPNVVKSKRSRPRKKAQPGTIRNDDANPPGP